MVLQQLQLVRVWGNARPRRGSEGEFAGQTHSIVTDGSGQWSVTLTPMNANAQPADLVVTGKNTITLKKCAGWGGLDLLRPVQHAMDREAGGQCGD